ncbi:MAG: WD40-repeat-containing domain protein [Benniella sp.]|nr:MAG: WD40-repeat-containing domain protein [Benniella sp.]
MVFGSIISSPRGKLSLQQVLNLANVYLENASKATDPDIVMSCPPQLASCLALLRASPEAEEILDSAARDWLQTTKKEQDEQDRLKTLATDIIRAFKREEFKDAKAVAEVVYLAPALEKDDFRYLLKEFYSGIDQSGLLDIHQLEGLAQLIQSADPGYLDSDDLVKILRLLSTRLRDTHQQSTTHLYQLTMAVSRVLDAMADTEVKGLDRETIHEPLSSYLDGLKSSTDSYLVYQAAYAYQALICVPDNETLWQATLRRTGKVVKGVSGLVSAVKGLNLNGFIEGLKDIQQGLAGASEVVQLVKTAYEGATSLTESGQGFLECMKEGLSFDRKCAWYSALRGADTLIQEGQLADFRQLVCEAPCRRDPSFLREIYRNDDEWGNQVVIKQWVLNILVQLSSREEGEMRFAHTLLDELQKDGDAKRQTLYRLCRENVSCSHPLKVTSPELGSPSLLDRVQKRPDVEGNLRQLRKQRLKERGNAVYIPPQAKANLQARDDARFPLMEKVEEFLSSDQKVFLLLGDSGAGKSTFNRELEYHLWQEYKKGGTIPLHINLPAIEKPEHDMIAKQLRKVEFTEPQIRELKLHRKFILICDGYDESQQNNNLYTSNGLNEAGEWSAKMVISCRSEYLGTDYRDRFQPGDRNHRSNISSLQEAVITPFSIGQVQEYIDQYVSVQRPLWEAKEYRTALDMIPSLKELVRNPFLMSLSLEVLPRMVDPGQDLTATHITRVALYDQFIEHWLERGKKRLGEKTLSPQARSAFEGLSDEGFTQNGINYLKKLSVAIYKEQDGQPIVRYSRYKDENTWKVEFFSREEEIQLLREACPLIRNGNQYRFIHRSLLEYGLALAAFDPQDWKEKSAPKSALARRGSTNSVLSLVEQGPSEAESAISEQEPDLRSPLTWRYFVNEPSVLQFLEERVLQEPLFKQQLFGYIEQSKSSKKWRIAAANAITLLVRAGVQFNGADLRGIQIPKADLSNGLFDSAQLQGADLRHVNLGNVWLRHANLSKTQMTCVQFGELPFLTLERTLTLIVYSPDEKSIAFLLDTGKINVYSRLTWKKLWILDGHEGNVKSVIYSPDGGEIASCGDDCTVRLWDIRTGVCRHVLTGHSNYVRAIAFSPRGDQIASASSDKTVKVWDVATGNCRHILIGHTRILMCVAYSPDGSQITSGGYDRTVRLWNIATGENCQVLRGHSLWVMEIFYSPQGDTVASVSGDGTLGLWNVATGDCLRVFASSGASVAFSRKGDQVASVGKDNTVQLYNIKAGMYLHTLAGHSAKVTCIMYSSQGDVVASSSNDKTVRLWDVETGICRQTLIGHSQAVTSVVFSMKGDQVASSSEDMTVRLWDVGAGVSRRSHAGGHSGTATKIICSPSGRELATCSDDMTLGVWSVETGECLHTLSGHRKKVYHAVYSPQGDQLATCSFDSTVRLWNRETGVCNHVLTTHSGEVNHIAYSPQGDWLASASDDRTVRLWDAKTGMCLFTMEGHSGLVFNIVFSPDGSQIASGSFDKTIRLWDVETGACIKILMGHHNVIYCIVYSPQGDRILSGSNDNDVRIWNMATGECRHVLTGHTDAVGSIKYSPTGEQVASTSKDSTVKLWDVATGACLQTLSGHSVCLVIQYLPGAVNDIEWIPSDEIDCFATTCEDGSVRMWEVMREDGKYGVHLRWSSMNNALVVTGAIVQDVQGLSELNKQLLKQRGAVGEPSNPLRDASKKVATMASVVSQLVTASDNAVEERSPTAVSVEHLEQRAEQATDPLVREILAAVVRDIHGSQ